ncbi:hypothetical protein OIO89_00650 (plasmid) [Mycobacterium ulcerans]|nr:hypothetical protein OIO89_00650 [Mycobacterium ulcerans]
MSSPSEPSAYTLADAGKQLGVTAQRVSQMLSSGELTGPQYPQQRVPKNAVRVWKWSLDQELARRRSTPRHVTHADNNPTPVPIRSTSRNGGAAGKRASTPLRTNSKLPQTSLDSMPATSVEKPDS